MHERRLHGLTTVYAEGPVAGVLPIERLKPFAGKPYHIGHHQLCTCMDHIFIQKRSDCSLRPLYSPGIDSFQRLPGVCGKIHGKRVRPIALLQKIQILSTIFASLLYPQGTGGLWRTCCILIYKLRPGRGSRVLEDEPIPAEVEGRFHLPSGLPACPYTEHG